MPSAYGRIAPLYQALEYLAFGRSLERARTRFIDRLSCSRRIVVFGGGDGRSFRSLLDAAPQAEFISIDTDARMTSLARSRVAQLGASERVRFICEDARHFELEGSYDGVVTHFFLDCFSAAELNALIPRIGAGLLSEAPWIFADFAIPCTPLWSRWRAKTWVWFLCWFFRWQAGHTLRTLPPMEILLKQHSFRCEETDSEQSGLIRSAVYRRMLPT